jgi:ABC-2 type transport system permease protein
VAWHEYRQHVLRRRFLVALLSLPVFFGVLALVTLLLIQLETDQRPVGYVDRSGFLAAVPVNDSEEAPDLIAYPSVAAAQEALQEGAVQAYFVFESDYLQSGKVQAVAGETLSVAARQAMQSQVQRALLAGQPAQLVERLQQGSQVVVSDLPGSRRFDESQVFNLFMPVLALMMFMLAIFSTSGYLMQAITIERENRTLEVLATSLSTRQLMGGKTIGIMGVGLTQIGVWVGLALAGIWLLRGMMPVLQTLRLSAGLVLLMVAVLIPAFTIIAAIMAAIGAVVADFNEGQQLSGPFSFPFLIPFLLIGLLLQNPNSPLAVGLSLVPFTAPATLIMRATLTSVPAWQIALSLALLVLTAVGCLWLAARAFRLGMLSYGQSFNLRRLLGWFRLAR